MTRVNIGNQKPRHLQNHPLEPVESLPLRSLFKENLGSIGRAISAGLLFIPFWIFIGIITAIGNAVGSILAAMGSSRIPQPETSDLLSALDALWYVQPSSKAPKQIANVVMKLGQGMVMKDFLDILTNRLLNVKNPRGNPPYIYMRFRQRLYTIPGTSRHVFAFAPRFDIANHIHQIPEEVDDMDRFMDWVGTISTTNLEQEKPLWEMHVRTDFGPESCSILLFRYHMSITDGQSMIQAFCRDVLDNGEQAYARMKPRFGGLYYATHLFQAIMMSGFVFFTDLLFSSGKDLNPFKYPDMKLSGKFDIIWSEPVNHSVIQRLKTITKVHFNDLVLTALAATLRTYCKLHGITTPADMTACVPVDLRPSKQDALSELKLGNRFVMQKIKLPVSQEAGMAQLWRVRDQTHRARHSYRHAAMDFLIKLMGVAFHQRTVQAIINRYFSGCSLMVNSLAGPDGLLTLQKFKVEQMMMWAPPPQGMQIPLSVNVITNNDEIFLVIVADTGVIKDAFWLAMDFPHEVMALGNLLKTRHTSEGTPSNKHPEEGEVPGIDTEQAVQASLHALEERLVKIQVKLRELMLARDDITKVPPLWKTFKLTLPEPGASGIANEDGSEYSEYETGSGDYESEEDDEDEDSDQSSEERPSVPMVKQTINVVEALPTDTLITIEPKSANENVSRTASATKPDVQRRTSALGDRARDRRMSSKPMIFSPRTSLPDPTADDAETPVRIPGRALRGRPPRRLSLNKAPGQGALIAGARIPRNGP